MEREELAHRLEVRANIVREAQRLASIKARNVEALVEAVDGVQPCTVSDCNVKARYFSTRQNFCENHLLIQRSDIFKSGLVMSV